MARTINAKRIQKSSNKNSKTLKHKNNLSMFMAAFGGAAFGIALMLAVALPMMQRQLQTGFASLNHKIVSIQPASAKLLCTTPSGAQATGNSTQTKATIQTASSSMPSLAMQPTGGTGGAPAASANTNVARWLGTLNASSTGTNSYTGAGSTNTVTATNKNTTTVNNTNNVTATNNNSQTASSGNVNTSQNTTAGNNTSGSASNSSDASWVVRIDN